MYGYSLCAVVFLTDYWWLALPSGVVTLILLSIVVVAPIAIHVKRRKKRLFSLHAEPFTNDDEDNDYKKKNVDQ